MSTRSNQSVSLVVGQVLFFLLPQFAALGEEEGPGLEEEFAAISTLEHDELEEEFELLEDQATVYSVSKHEQSINESPLAVTVITQSQIENTYCSDIACLLAQVPEVDLAQFKRMYTAVGVRAFSNDVEGRVLVLVDGRDIDLEILGPPWWDALPVHMEEVERIEVIRGPSSALYGSNAFAVISITTKQTSKDGAGVFFSGGENGSSNLFGQVDKVFGNLSLHLAASEETANNWQVQGAQEKALERFRVRLAHKTDSSSSCLEVGYSNPRGALYAAGNPGGILGSHIAHLQATHSRDLWQARLFFYLMQMDYFFDLQLFYGGIKLGEMPDRLTLLSTELDGDVQANFELFKSNLLILGAGYRWTGVLSKDFVSEENFEHRAGIFAHDEQRLGEHFVITAGARFDYNTLTELSVSPQLALVWHTEDHQLRLAAGTAFRKPSFLNSGFNLKGAKNGIAGLDDFVQRALGNPNIGNERLNVLEAGFRSKIFGGRLQLEGDVFYQELPVAVVWKQIIKTNSLGIPDFKTSSMRYENDDDNAMMLGGSLSASVQWSNQFWIASNYTYRYAVYASDPPDMPSKKKGDRHEWEPQHIVNLNGYHRLPGGITWGAGLRYTSSRIMAKNEGGSSIGQMSLFHAPGVFILNAYAAWRLEFHGKFVELGARFANMLNATYADSPVYLRFDGNQQGSDRIDREFTFFLRGSI